jgi:hypothetical protein
MWITVCALLGSVNHDRQMHGNDHDLLRLHWCCNPCVRFDLNHHDLDKLLICWQIDQQSGNGHDLPVWSAPIWITVCMRIHHAHTWWQGTTFHNL